TALIALQSAPTPFNMTNVLALHVPVDFTRPPEQARVFYREAMRRIAELSAVERVAVGTAVPWRDKNVFGPGFQFSVEGYTKANGEEDSRARFRTVSPGFFAALGVPIVAGRDFTDADRADTAPVVIISESIARRMFGSRDVVDRQFMWTDPVMKFVGFSMDGRRIVGIAADVDDENVVPGPTMTVYHPFEQEIGGGRLFVHAKGDPYALVEPITAIIRGLAPDQPVERAATLQDVRAEVLAPDRLNALTFGGLAGVALMIAVVGVAGVLAFSVSARTREFGVRLAIGSSPRHLLVGVLKQGAAIAAIGIVVGVFGGLLIVRLVGGFIEEVTMPGVMPVLGAAVVLAVAAVLASVVPAARAARINVLDALRSE
ncbi:MAG: ABC transporter permease, partial [Acidobacteria bacterium]|nr:ABC transporter permease [Acidobacteriota bacterium]